MEDIETVYKQIFKVGYSGDTIDHVFTLKVDQELLFDIFERHSLQLPHLQHVVSTFLEILNHGSDRLSETMVSNTDLIASAPQKVIYLDGEDITQLRGARNLPTMPYYEPEEDVSEQKRLRQLSMNAIDTNNVSRKPLMSNTTTLADFEVAANIMLVLLVWLEAVEISNGKLHTSKNSFGSAPEQDSVDLLFHHPAAKEDLVLVLQCCKRLLAIAAAKIKDPEFDDDMCLLACKRILILLVSLQRLSISSILLYNKSDSDATLAMLRSVVEVNFSQPLYDILLNTAVKYDGLQYKFASVQLSYNALSLLFLSQGVLASLPASLLPLDAYSLQPDISSPEKLCNPYAGFLKLLNFDEDTYVQFFVPRLCPILAKMYAAFYEESADLYVEQVKGASFVAWVTANTIGGNPYAAKSVAAITDFHNNKEQYALVQDKKSQYLEDVNSILNSPTVTDYKPLLRVILWMSAYSFNADFLWCLTTVQKSQILDLFLCTISYVVRNFHDSEQLQAIAKLSTTILLKITSPNVGSYKSDSYKKIISNLHSYVIDEYSFKLCHQSSPIVPVSLDDLGKKAALYYILDICQVFLRSNLTRKLNIEVFKSCTTIIFQVIQEVGGQEEKLSTYAWIELYKTLIEFLVFTRKQKILKHAESPQLSSLIEEVFCILNEMLGKKFSGITHDSIPVVYELIYQIMGSAEDLTALLTDLELLDSGTLSTICGLLSQLGTVMSEDSEVDYRMLVESGKLNAILTKSHEKHGTSGYRFKDTFLYYGCTIDFQRDESMLKVCQQALGEK